MGWFDKPKEERKADIDRHKALKRAANNTARKFRTETFASDALNRAVIESEKDVPWWRR